MTKETRGGYGKMAHFEQWEGFAGKNWRNSVDVRDFIQENYTPYDGDESFLESRLKQQTNCGEDFRNFRQRNAQRAEFLIWKQKLFLDLTAYGPRIYR